MAKKKVETVEETVATVEVNANDIVYCNVEKQFKDSTRGDRFMRVDDCYRTTRERADKLVAAGYLSYYDDQVVSVVVEDAELESTEDDDTDKNATPNNDPETGDNGENGNVDPNASDNGDNGNANPGTEDDDSSNDKDNNPNE